MVGCGEGVFIVIIVKDGETILVRKTSAKNGGQLESSITIISWINSYCMCIYSRPDVSGLVGLRVDRHDCFVDSLLGDQMSQCFKLRNVLAHATSLVIHFRIVAGGAGVPQGNIIAAREAVVVVVEVFGVVHQHSAAIGKCGSRCGGENARG